MGKTYIFARKNGIIGTRIMELDMKEAINELKKNIDTDFEIGILSGGNYSSLVKVYNEYAPFKKVLNKDELLEVV